MNQEFSPIKRAIDELLLHTEDTIMLFEEQREGFVRDRELYLTELMERLIPERVQAFIDRRTWIDDGGGWSPEYRYGREDIPLDEELTYEDSHGLYGDDFSGTAHQHWIKRKLEETAEILKRVKKELGIHDVLDSELVGIQWKSGDKELKYLYDRLCIEELITETSTWELFHSVFRKQRLKDAPPIKWTGSKQSLGYLFYLLKEGKLIVISGYLKAIEEHNLFNFDIDQSVGRLGNEVHRSKEGTTSMDVALINRLTEIVTEIS